MNKEIKAIRRRSESEWKLIKLIFVLCVSRSRTDAVKPSSSASTASWAEFRLNTGIKKITPVMIQSIFTQRRRACVQLMFCTAVKSKFMDHKLQLKSKDGKITFILLLLTKSHKIRNLFLCIFDTSEIWVFKFHIRQDSGWTLRRLFGGKLLNAVSAVGRCLKRSTTWRGS